MKLLFLLFIPVFCFSQTNNLKFSSPSETNAVLVGYQASFDPKKNEDDHDILKTVHIVEISYSKIYDRGGRHPASVNYYVGNDFIVNFKQFIIGPKFGVNFSASALSIGSEMSFYTDFEKFSPRLSPFIGFGVNGFKLFISFPIKFSKTEFIPVNTLNLGITVPVFSTNNKKSQTTTEN
ncbi:hypothetical protein ASG31_11720 [Chryseobacterium sp. Leaf404]|uniref:hypothetical protein n=1 Tax=unclassified Chryseobacterium TaxID=2593645 RepID=UPI0006F6A115|nr:MULTISPECIES: hypothetical protein [unclassified Chryseobacterium]KQT17024.1 hypothetical protein ASG31_11720 [Chryseobacterium sp. Leaf404]